ncbi:polyphosphate kinase 2, partial [Vibrio chemaguriensis]|nr:polyphosphate kinase 2 [Vibrio chemaguriensis]
EYKALEYPPIELPEINKEGYVRAPIDDQTFVPDKY